MLLELISNEEDNGESEFVEKQSELEVWRMCSYVEENMYEYVRGRRRVIARQNCDGWMYA